MAVIDIYRVRDIGRFLDGQMIFFNDDVWSGHSIYAMAAMIGRAPKSLARLESAFFNHMTGEK